MSRSTKHSRLRNYSSFFDSRSRTNPFEIPDDNQIFSFREEERRERNKKLKQYRKLKIWEKDIPSRAGCLRKLCGDNIPNAPIAINTKFDKSSMNRTHDFVIPVERPKNKQNRWKLITK